MKVRNVGGISSSESLRDTVLDPNLVIEHDSGLKNRCSPSRFREIASGNLQLTGGSTVEPHPVLYPLPQPCCTCCSKSGGSCSLYYRTCAYRIPAGRLNNNPLPVQRGLPQRHAETRASLLNSHLSSRQPPAPPPHGQRPASSSGTHPRRAPQDAPTGTCSRRQASTGGLAGLGSSRAAIRPACGTRHECSVKSTTEKRVRAPA